MRLAHGLQQGWEVFANEQRGAPHPVCGADTDRATDNFMRRIAITGVAAGREQGRAFIYHIAVQECFDVARNRDFKLRFLVATVPDPIESAADEKFDQAIQAIRMAAESGGYLLDHFYSPWADREQDKYRYRQHPGLLLFRKASVDRAGPGEILSVLLVGETPTWGIHKYALQNALDLVAAHQQNEADHDGAPGEQGRVRSRAASS